MSTQPSYDPEWSVRLSDFGCEPYAEGPGVTGLRLSGELDLATAPQLADALAQAGRDSVAVILDLSELTFMDSSGLHVILNARASLAEAGSRLVLLRGGHQVHRIFELTGVADHLEFVSSRDTKRLVAVQSR